jgi:uncharacterized membrane protein HdeD (DUF308 family)
MGLGLVLTGVPEDHEGKTILDLGPGHGVTQANAAALIFLGAGILYFSVGALVYRRFLQRVLVNHPLQIIAGILTIALGSSFLLESGVSTILRWWGPGVVILLMGLSYLGFILTPSRLSKP